ncbi:hypothetical protein, partial [Enterobacter hormaechei]|uniref:hypothetical protein n=1 Tax=Enterobacter hormaechei TaxID=158836 RepID=UPI0025A285F4
MNIAVPISGPLQRVDMAQKVLPNLVTFVVNRGVSILIDDDAVAILYGFDKFLVTHNLQQG